MNPKPAKLSDKKIQAQSDGSMFWKITTGRNLMASYATSISDADRWAVVDYIRSFGLKP